jgi:3-methyl-2-oxobutanoate hydroxymethyltransferase
MGHLGLTPQSIYKFGTYTVRAKERKEEAHKLIRRQLNYLGKGWVVFCLGLEKNAHLARKVAQSISIPVSGLVLIAVLTKASFSDSRL